MDTYYHVRKLRSEERLAAIARDFIAMMALMGPAEPWRRLPPDRQPILQPILSIRWVGFQG
jgi:hypothetical protein